MNFTWETRRDSDHYSFFAQQIPYLMIFTGKHPEYHTPYDDVDKLNVDGMERITRLLFRAVYAAAQQPALPAVSLRPPFGKGPRRKSRRKRRLPDPPARLGVTWDEARAKQNVIASDRDRPRFGRRSRRDFRSGDRIVRVRRRADRDSPTTCARRSCGSRRPTTAVVERSGRSRPAVADGSSARARAIRSAFPAGSTMPSRAAPSSAE